MKTAISWLLGRTVLVFLLCLITPLGFGAMAMSAMVSGTGFGHPLNPPTIAGNARIAAIKPVGDPAEQRWNAIVQRYFPPGTKVQDMLVVLKDQGFAINTGHHSASYDWGGMPCLYTVSVDWRENAAQRIATINGRAYSGCL
jgi:hypothetical protein